MLQVLPNVTVTSEDGARKYKNMMVQDGLNWMLDLVAGLAPGTIAYIAVGDDGTPTTLGDTQLRAEKARKTVTVVTRDSGAALAEVFFDKLEANFYWKELGLFVGGDHNPNTGKLIARAVTDEAKNDKRTATVTWEIGVKNA